MEQVSDESPTFVGGWAIVPAGSVIAGCKCDRDPRRRVIRVSLMSGLRRPMAVPSRTVSPGYSVSEPVGEAPMTELNACDGAFPGRPFRLVLACRILAGRSEMQGLRDVDELGCASGSPAVSATGRRDGKPSSAARLKPPLQTSPDGDAASLPDRVRAELRGLRPET